LETQATYADFCIVSVPVDNSKNTVEPVS
jgi:hypothetical protein